MNKKNFYGLWWTKRVFFILLDFCKHFIFLLLICVLELMRRRWPIRTGILMHTHCTWINLCTCINLIWLCSTSLTFLVDWSFWIKKIPSYTNPYVIGPGMTSKKTVFRCYIFCVSCVVRYYMRIQNWLFFLQSFVLKDTSTRAGY